MTPQSRLSQPEFIVLMALIMSTAAFSTDAMLPAFPQIAAELAPATPERTALIVSLFVMGMGLGTFVTGPLSDRFGRKAVMTGGYALYALGSVMSWLAPSFALLLAGRVLQGLGVAAPRVVVPAMIRDLYEGRKMAQITSIIVSAFLLVPAAAPFLGQIILSVAGWRAIFLGFVVLAIVVSLWLNLRQPETLPGELRRPLTADVLVAGLREVLSHRAVQVYTLALTLGFSILITLISMIQPIYGDHFGAAAIFPLLFMGGALSAAAGTLTNASLVMRVGMRRLVRLSFLGQVLAAMAWLILSRPGVLPAGWGLWLFFLWALMFFLLIGFAFGNLNALALQPLGHVAGLTASVITALSTVGAAAVAGVVGTAAGGNPVALVALAAAFSAAALLLLLLADRGHWN